MKYDFIDYNFIKTIIAVIIGAMIPVIANLLLEKTRLTNNKKKLKYEKNLNTLRKLKVNHLILDNLINEQMFECFYKGLRGKRTYSFSRDFKIARDKLKRRISLFNTRR
jgi:hypothetical protein